MPERTAPHFFTWPVSAFFSHDEYIDFFAEPDGSLADGITSQDRLRVRGAIRGYAPTLSPDCGRCP
jgi:hypothetical protein